MADLHPPAGPTGSTGPGPDSDIATETARCASGLRRCGAVCVNLQSDPAHFSVCGATCDDGQMCQGGACTGSTLQCAGDLTDCD